MKRAFFSYFFLAAVFISITLNYNVTVVGLTTVEKIEDNHDYIYTKSNTMTSNKKDSKVQDLDLFLNGEEVVEVFKPNNNIQLNLTKSDIDLMAKIVFAESKGEPYEGKIAVASVILNRVINPKFPNTVENVIKQKNAFSCVVNGEIDVVPNSDCYNAVIEAIRGNDPTSQALFFYNPDIATCQWMQGSTKSNMKSIGNHVFFNIE